VRSLNRDEYIFLKRDIMIPLELMEASMSLAGLASAQDMEVLQQWKEKRASWSDEDQKDQETDSDDALEESEEAEEEK
jgi:hypothetical protein